MRRRTRLRCCAPRLAVPGPGEAVGGGGGGGEAEVAALQQKVHKLRGLLLRANQEIERLSAAQRPVSRD